MEKENLHLLSQRWWNPLLWLIVLFAPVVCMLAGCVCGVLTGLLAGYERGLDFARRKVSRMLASMP